MVNKQATYWYNRVFHIIHSDIAALMPNQEIKFLTGANMKHEEESKEESVNKGRKGAYIYPYLWLNNIIRKLTG